MQLYCGLQKPIRSDTCSLFQSPIVLSFLHHRLHSIVWSPFRLFSGTSWFLPQGLCSFCPFCQELSSPPCHRLTTSLHTGLQSKEPTQKSSSWLCHLNFLYRHTHSLFPPPLKYSHPHIYILNNTCHHLQLPYLPMYSLICCELSCLQMYLQ